MGIGPVHTIGLAKVRERAADARKLVLEGIDPLEQKRAVRASQRLEEARTTMTFDQCAAAYIEAHRESWHNAKHAGQWETTLKTYASPVLGSLPCSTST